MHRARSLRFVWFSFVTSVMATLAGCAREASHVVLANGRQIPAVVAAQADAWIREQGKSGSSGTLRERFAEDFLSGFMAGSLYPNAPDGYAAGVAWRTAHPDSVRDVMLGYGFEAVACDGDYLAGFEVSAFAPAGNAAENWWVEATPALPETHREASALATSRSVHVVGFLSPVGSYGHLSQYPRRLFATEMVVRKS